MDTNGRAATPAIRPTGVNSGMRFVASNNSGIKDSILASSTETPAISAFDSPIFSEFGQRITHASQSTPSFSNSAFAEAATLRALAQEAINNQIIRNFQESEEVDQTITKGEGQKETKAGAEAKAKDQIEELISYEEVSGTVGPGGPNAAASEELASVDNGSALTKENVFTKLAQTVNNSTILEALKGLKIVDGDDVSGAAGWWSGEGDGVISLGDNVSNIETAMHEIGHALKNAFGGVAGEWSGTGNDGWMNALHEKIRDTDFKTKLNSWEYGFQNDNANGSHDPAEEFAVVFQNYAMDPDKFKDIEVTIDGETKTGKEILDETFKDQTGSAKTYEEDKEEYDKAFVPLLQLTPNLWSLMQATAALTNPNQGPTSLPTANPGLAPQNNVFNPSSTLTAGLNFNPINALSSMFQLSPMGFGFNNIMSPNFGITFNTV